MARLRRTTSALEVLVETDGELAWTLTWEVAGVPQDEAGTVLSAEHFHKGDRVEVTVAWGSEELSDALTVQNTAPTAPEVRASFEERLSCTVEVDATDADDDGLDYRFTWEHELGGSAEGPSVEDPTPGSWTCAGQAFDGEEWGPEGVSESVVVPSCDPDKVLELHFDGDYADSSCNAHVVDTVGEVSLEDGAVRLDNTRNCSWGADDEYLRVPQHESWNFTDGTFSVSAWARWDSDASLNYSQAFVAVDELDGWYFITSYAYGVGLYLYDNNGSGPVPAYVTTELEALVWHHFAVVTEGGQATFYEDGVALGSSAAKSSYPGAGDLLLGQWHEGWGDFDGWMDDVTVWSRALSGDEVRSEYELGRSE